MTNGEMAIPLQRFQAGRTFIFLLRWLFLLKWKFS